MHRRLTGGDICEQLVDISAHKHYGHSSALKVRPTVGVSHTKPVPRKSVLGVSKVGPLAFIPPFKYPENDMPTSDTDSHGGHAGVIEAPAKNEEQAGDVAGSGISTDNNPKAVEDDIDPGAIGLAIDHTPRRSINDGEVDFEGLPLSQRTADNGHHGHSHASKVRAADLGTSDSSLGQAEPVTTKPDHPASYGFRSQLTGFGAWIRPQHESEPSHITPKDQSYSGNDTGTDAKDFSQETNVSNSRKQERRSRTSESSKSASELIAYWETFKDQMVVFGTEDSGDKPPRQRSQTSPKLDEFEVLEKTVRDSFSRLQQGAHDPSLERSSQDSRNKSFSAPFPGGNGVQQTTKWFWELVKPQEAKGAYTSKLTSFPEKKEEQSSPPVDAPPADRTMSQKSIVMARELTRRSTASGSIDKKFKHTVSTLEKLMNEAMSLANAAADRGDHDCSENLELDDIDQDRTQSDLPPANDGFPDRGESGFEEKNPIERHSSPPMPPKETTTNGPVRRVPKHYRSTPGTNSRNVAVNIPERNSSLMVYKHNPRYATRRIQSPDGYRWLATPYDDDEEPPMPPGCIPRMIRKIKSCHSSTTPRLHHRTSSLHPKGDTAPPIEREPTKDDKDEIIFKSSEGKLRKSGSHSYDGANDDDYVWSTEHDLHQGADGTESTNARQFHRPQVSYATPQEELTVFEQDEPEPTPGNSRFNLRGRAHISIRGPQGFSLARAYKRQPAARDWSAVRKRFVATVACISTAVIGILIGIYAGMVPSIQYWIADLDHYAIMGNAYFYVGLAIPTFLFWPLPLLHGRKPYILSSLVLAMPLLFPQAIAVSEPRSPFVSTWR